MKYRRPKQPTEKMLKAIALREANPELPNTEIGRMAGYAPSTVRNLNGNVFNKPIVKSIMDNYRYELEQHGINPKRLASKLDELLDAKNPIITMAGPLIDKQTGEQVYRPDRKIQVEAIKLLHDVYQIKAEKNPEGVKRRITLEDFEEKEGISE